MIASLLDRAQEIYGESPYADHVREILVSALRLMPDRASRADVKLINSTLKELRHAFRVFAPYKHVRKVAVFGSARTTPDQVEWQQAQAFARRMKQEGWMTITGAGGGIMGAAQRGAGRESSFGVNIRLPLQQRANEEIAGDSKLIHFRYFFTRKIMFVKEAHAFALFPGGFGTLDEAFEALTLIQTGKSEIVPVVFVDSPGGSNWSDWKSYLHAHPQASGRISEADLNLFQITENVEEAVSEILNFYSNYHSSRYVGDLLVLRVRRAPDPEQLEELNRDFKGILSRGVIAVSQALPEEAGEAEYCPRITLHFNRRDLGRLRLLIDRLNALVPGGASPAREASPPEIVEEPLSAEAEDAELNED